MNPLEIVLLRVRGELENGKHSDVNFRKIEEILMNKGAYFMLRNTHDLSVKETGVEIKVKADADIEKETIKIYSLILFLWFWDQFISSKQCKYRF